MSKTYVKQALLTGAGSMFLDFMETEETPSADPIYAKAVMETPSLESVNAQMEVSSNQVFLSNILHSDLSAVQSVTVPVTAGYLPRGFAEKAQGMLKIGGGWSMPTTPKAKPFRLAIPFTDENGDELILNLPKCTLAPVNIEGQTETADRNAQMKTYNITGIPLLKPITVEGKKVHLALHTMDMADPENKTTYSRDLLLEKGWFDETSVKLCESTQEP